MKNLAQKMTMALAIAGLFTLQSEFAALRAQGTAFTYQGRLNSGTNAANGLYDFQSVSANNY